MSEVVIQTVEKGLTDLFRHAYEANCELEGEEVTMEDRMTLEDLSTLETLENLKDLVESLLEAKRELKKSDKAELAERCEQFERLLQKLEGEVRNHIRVRFSQIEQQLKLHAEATQSRLDELQRKTESTEESSLKPESSHHRILSVGGDTRILELAEYKHKVMLQLEKECNDLKSVFSLKRTEYERTKGDYERLLREMQLARVKPSKENLPRKPSNERTFKAGISPERPLTDRTNPSRTVKAESPYQPVLSQLRTSSKSKLDVSDILRLKAHQRSGSERSKKPCKRM